MWTDQMIITATPKASLAALGLLLVVAGCVQRMASGRENADFVPPDSILFISEPCPAPHSAAEAPLEPPPPDSAAPIRTDQHSYVWPIPCEDPTASVLIGVRYTNRSPDTAFVAPNDHAGGRFVLERWREGGWTKVYQPNSTLDPSNPTRVPPGGTLQETVLLPTQGVWNKMTFWMRDSSLGVADLSGWYRLRYTIYRGWKGWYGQEGTLRPEAERVSNPFRITAPLEGR